MRVLLRENDLKQKLILINGRFMSQPVTGVQRYAREVIAALVKSGGTQFKFIIAMPDRNSFEPIPDTETFHDNSFLPTAIWQQVRLPLLMKKLWADLLWSSCDISLLLLTIKKLLKKKEVM